MGKDTDNNSYDDFINAVWVFESDIDPAKQSYYNDNWTKPIVDSYPKVTEPGRVIRDPNTGDPVPSGHLTFQEFFAVIGLKDLYDPSDANPDWNMLQANVINYLGFVGFQFQESDLHDLGYYDYPLANYEDSEYPSHYVYVDNSHWKNGVTQFYSDDPKVVSQPTVVTDVVQFYDENFTGFNNINSVADFKDPVSQRVIIEDHFKNKYDRIVDGLSQQGKTLSDYIGTTVTWDGLSPPITPPPGGRDNTVTLTMSGLLAGAHLRGALGVIDLLVQHGNSADENGTHILQYVQDYAGYDTPFT
jgi:hypothetical protein